jgi:imidazolonepropionase-like amidohydrolase
VNILSRLGAVLLLFCSCPATTSRPIASCPAPLPTETHPTPRYANRVRTSPTLIRGATVWTAAGAILQRTDVLLRDGRIAEIGRDLTAPAGAVVIDGRGKHLTPGLIDPHSHIGVYPLPYLDAHSDGNEVGKPMSPSVRAADAFWPQDPALSLALAAGVTTALIVPGSANLIGGQGLTIKLVPGRSAEDLRFPGAPATLKMACGENPKRVYGNKGGPSSRMGSVARVRELLQQAVEYRQRWRRFRSEERSWRDRQARRCRGATRGGIAEEKDALPPDPPKRDLAIETVVEALEGRARVQWHCYRADEMLRLISVAKEYGLPIGAFHHAVEAYKIRDVLRRERVAIVTWINWWGFKAEAYDAIPEAPALIGAAGGLVALHSDSSVVIQRLNHEAALAYFRGRDLGLPLREEDAINTVTSGPARILGIDHLTGTIARGKMADVVLWDGHPLSVYTRVERVFVDGRPVYDRLAAGRRPTDFELQLVPSPPPIAGPAREVPPLSSEWARPLQRVVIPPDAPTLAIVGGTVHTMTGDPPRLATIVARGGQIVAIGPAVNPPANAVRIDARGRDVTPGLIAAESTLGLVEINAERSASDDRLHDPKLSFVRATLRAADAINPHSAAIPVTRIEGFTTALVRPYGGLVSGQGAAFDLDGLSERDHALVAPIAIHANVGLVGARASAGSRALALQRLRQLLEDARTLRRARAAVETRRFRAFSAPYGEIAALLPVIERKLPLVVTVNRASDILAMLRLAQEQQIRLVLADAAEAWRVAEPIARAHVPVLVNVDRNLPQSFDSLGGRYDNAARLHHAGVLVAISADGDAHNVRYLRQVAGIAAAWGLPRPAALAALTSAPASIFGLSDRGVIKVGARANLVVWSGDPLELSTRVRQLVIGGRLVPLVSRQTLLRDRYLTLPPR